MLIRLYVDKVAALKAGKDKHGYQQVQVAAADLSNEERDELARYAENPHSYSTRNQYPYANSDFFLDRQGSPPPQAPPISEATPTTLREVLASLKQQRVQAAAQAEEKRRRDEEEAKNTRERLVPKVLATPLADLVEYNKPVNYLESDKIPWDDSRLVDKYKEVKTFAAVQAAQRAAREEEQKRLDAERRQAATEKLRQWALEHGSEFLRDRIQDGFEWEGLAESEFAAAQISVLDIELSQDVRPQGYVEVSTKDRTTPSHVEIKALREIQRRAQVAHVTSAAKLIWVKYVPDPEDSLDYPEEDPIEQAEMEVIITAPNGAERFFYFLAPSE